MGMIVIESIDSMWTIYLLYRSHRNNASRVNISSGGSQCHEDVNAVCMFQHAVPRVNAVCIASGYVSACRVNAVSLCTVKAPDGCA